MNGDTVGLVVNGWPNRNETPQLESVRNTHYAEAPDPEGNRNTQHNAMRRRPAPVRKKHIRLPAEKRTRNADMAGNTHPPEPATKPADNTFHRQG